MDAADYETNTLLINNISSVAFRIYEPVAAPSSTYTFAVSDVENALRSGGHLVYADSLRRGIWCFHLVAKDGSSVGAEYNVLGATPEVCGYRLGLVDSGYFEPVSLLRGLSPGANPASTPSSTTPGGTALDAAARNSQAFNNNTMSSQAFGYTSQDVEAKMAMTATVEAKGYATVPVKEMYEYFISAVLSSLSSTFCARTGAIALNSRSLVFPARGVEEDEGQRFPPITLATFRIYLTTTGTLLITLCHTMLHGIATSAEKFCSSLLPLGSPVLAAPLGVFATFQGLADGDYSIADGLVVQSPDTQITRPRLDGDERLAQWRSACAKIINMRGMSATLFQGSTWLILQYLRRRPAEQKTDGKRTPVSTTPATVLWPSALCFWKPGSITWLNQRLSAPSSPAPESDPLVSARTWYLESVERDDALAKRVKERETNAGRDSVGHDGRSQAPEGYSPLALRRASHNGAATVAAGAMYPTPPDGVQNPAGVTPSVEGVACSPANNGSSTAVADADVTMTNTGQAGDPFGESWENGETKRERTFDAEPENLYGDLGADIFGDNDITDADFSFFDEEPGGSDLGFGGVVDMVVPPLDPVPNHHEPVEADIRESQPVEQQLSQGGPVSPVFAKPELKHARSILADEARQNASDRGSRKNAPGSGIKRQPSPFNAETVYKRVKASLSLASPAGTVSSLTERSPQRRSSLFEKVDFNPFLSYNNKKYEENGRFNYQWTTQNGNGTLDLPHVPTTDYFRRHGKGRGGLKELSANMGALIASITGGIENSSLQSKQSRADDSSSDADDISLISDEDDNSIAGDEPLSPAKSGATRRRLDDDSISLAVSLKELEGTTFPSPGASAELSKFSSSDAVELPMSRYFSDPEPVQALLSYSDEDVVVIAQVLTEQAASGRLELPGQDDELPCIKESRARRKLADQVRNSVETLRSVLPASLGGAATCQLKPFVAEVQDVTLLGQPGRLQPRPPAAVEQLRPNLFQIPAPHFELRRHDAKVSLVPSAVTFWEVLGLGPSAGTKDIYAACVFPGYEGMSDTVACFLDRMRILYESLKLGTHERLDTAAGVVDGLVPFDTDRIATPASSTLSRSDSAVTEQMRKLSQALASQTVSNRNFVIYFVYSPDNPMSIIESCAAFQRLFELYKKLVLSGKQSVSNELVLQLIRLDLLASPSAVVLPDTEHYTQLCLEVYDRCTLFGGPMPSPGIVLELPLPRVIDFKLATAPSANLFHENTCIHIAYAQSVDERWVTAAWTDNRGSKQMTASYCLGRKGKPLSTPFTDVAHEIWDTTHDLISVWKVHWRVVIAKCGGPMDQDEMDFWTELAKTETKASVTLTLLTVDTRPSLQLVPPAVKMPMAAATSMFYSTPVSTPQASSILSPEQSGGGYNNPPTPLGTGGSGPTATTPGGSNNDNAATDPEGDASLVDATDVTWGAVMSHRLSNSSALADLNPALASGYLVKRGGTRVEDPPVLMEVNVVHSDGNPRAHDVLLREMLTYFRGLGSVARARGIVDRETDVRPWHVAAAEKAARALYLLM